MFKKKLINSWTDKTNITSVLNIIIISELDTFWPWTISRGYSGTLQFVCLSIWPSLCSQFHLPARLSVCSSVNLLNSLSIFCLPICVSLCPSVNASVCMSAYLSICPFFTQSVFTSVFQLHKFVTVFALTNHIQILSSILFWCLLSPNDIGNGYYILQQCILEQFFAFWILMMLM